LHFISPVGANKQKTCQVKISAHMPKGELSFGLKNYT
jgi:hypothetical protein